MSLRRDRPESVSRSTLLARTVDLEGPVFLVGFKELPLYKCSKASPASHHYARTSGEMMLTKQTLDRFKETHISVDEASRKLHEALDNHISSSELNERRYELAEVGALEELRRERNDAWDRYQAAEADLIAELNEGLFPGEHRAG